MYNDRKGEIPDIDGVLHSWKSIAKFLSRSVRTARRWEENEDLPVRRHKHLKSNTVFAYTSELKMWLIERELPDPRIDAMKERHAIAQPKKFWQGITAWFDVTSVNANVKWK